MDALDIPAYRLYNQRLSATEFEDPADVVHLLGAVQAQDFAAAKWAVGQRTKGATDSTVEKAFNDGSILRTHMLRPTWHFVAPTDVRWIQKLTASRVKAANASMERKLELDAAIFRRSYSAIAKALGGGRQLTRRELGVALQRAGIPVRDNLRLTYMVMRAELDCLICSGPRRGRQFTYALLEERVPPMRNLDHDEAIAELTMRYFASRGPATVQDFTWWSGLTLAETKRGLEMVKSKLNRAVISGQTYWFLDAALKHRNMSKFTTHLLSNFDEYGISYRDHSTIFDTANGSDRIFDNMVLLRGRMIGTWKRTLQKDSVLVQLNMLKPLSKQDSRAINAALDRYGNFLQLPVSVP